MKRKQEKKSTELQTDKLFNKAQVNMSKVGSQLTATSYTMDWYTEDATDTDINTFWQLLILTNIHRVLNVMQTTDLEGVLFLLQVAYKHN